MVSRRRTRLALLLALIPIVCVAGAKGSNKAGSEYGGSWSGSIEIPGSPLGVDVTLNEEDGVLTGTIDIPLQGAIGLPLTTPTVVPGGVRFSIAGVAGEPTFSARREGDALVGTFTQSGQTYPFRLERAHREPARKPASHGLEQGEALALETDAGVLRGSLLLPEGDGPHPVALIIAGSGPTDRNGNNRLIPGRNDSLWLLGGALANAGIASLRYDKRGVGESASAVQGEERLRFGDFVADAIGWIRRLAADERLGRVAVIGHSEGSLLGMLAAREAGADAFVSIAGPGSPAADVIRAQLSQQPEALRAEAEAILTRLEAGETVDGVDPRLEALFRPSVQPYLISWFRHDPATELARLDIPVLIVQGTTDIQIEVAEAEHLRRAREDAAYLLIEGMNHVLKEAPAERVANAAAYSDPSLPLVPGLAEGIAAFLDNALAAAEAVE